MAAERDQVNILDEIAAKTKERIAEQKARFPLATLIDEAEAVVKAEEDSGLEAFAFEHALQNSDFGLICEVKKASPSKGIIEDDFRPMEVAHDYESAGADAISCLTEPYWFLGSDDYLQAISNMVPIPVLRKDFTVDEYMIYQAKVFGASAVLLICSILDDAQLASYIALANELGMSALVEAHDATEIERALISGARVIGVNNRNLKDFSVDLNNASSLRKHVPEGIVFVAESGVTSPEDIAIMAAQGCDAALVGEALMRSDNKSKLIQQMREAARSSR